MQLIYGRKPIFEALKSDVEIEKIIIPSGQRHKGLKEILGLANREKIKIDVIPHHKFNDITRKRNTQGIAAIISSIQYYDSAELIKFCKDKKNPRLLLLDSIQDPHNLGAILRTSECMGVDGVIMTIHQSAPITDVVEKTSAGAVNHLKIAKVTNLNQEITYLKENGFWIVGSSLENSKDYREIDYNMPIALIMGNEEKGIRKLIADNCDFLVSIPMRGKIQSLNVSVAAGILLSQIINN